VGRSAAALLVLCLFSAGPVGAAEPLPEPMGPVILIVSGAIDVTNAPGEARFDRAMLETLGTATVATTTAWTDGVRRFEGPRLEDVLHRVGAHGTVLEAAALNDFRNAIPLADLKYGIVLAMRMDGELLTPRHRGPLWIVYPRDAYPDLNDVRYDARWVWQLKSLRVE
jgi:hypothetical protein